MHVDENEFFRETTTRLCGNLDIRTAMQDCSEYIRQFVPLERMYLQLFDPHTNLLRIVSSVIREGEEGSKILHIAKQYTEMWMHAWDGYQIINNPRDEPWFWNDLVRIGRTADVSLLIIRMKTDGWLCWVALVATGTGVYTETHARLMVQLQKPFTIAVANALRHEEVLRLKSLFADEQQSLYKELKGLSDNIIGKQSGLKRVLNLCRDVAPLDTPVLLLGETGSGKDLLAHTIHNWSPRNQGPLVSVNCGAITETLMDSELFGHEKGAFTGAVGQKIGRFERANGGTIFLDEIGELSFSGQVKLLRILQYREIERVGGTRPISVDTRIIAATNRHLEEMVVSGQFRKDLWFRLNVYPINVPPLRQRREDIPELLYYFIEQKRAELKLDITPMLRPGAIDQLMSYDWPGNVRELANIVERALIRNHNGLLRLEELLILRPDDDHESTETANPTYEILNLDEVNSMHISRVLKLAKGRISGPGGAAELLGIHPNTLRKRMDKLGISYKRVQQSLPPPLR